MLVAISSAVVVGLVLTVVGLRGRRTDAHPLCRRCRFDLTGRSAGSTRCPECGADLSPTRAVVVGHRRRRRAVLAAGLTVTAAGLAAGGWAGWSAAATFDWVGHAPLWYLRREATGGDPARRLVALDELGKRYNDGRLSGNELAQVMDAGLAVQADVGRPWDPGWGGLIEWVHLRGRLSADRWARYACQSCGRTFTLRVRPRVRRGDPLPFKLDCGPVRTAGPWARGLWCEPAHLRLAWADGTGRTVAVRDWLFATNGTTAVLGTFLAPRSFAAAGPLGRRVVRLTGNVNVGPSEDGYVVDPVAVVPLDLSAPVDVLPAEQSSVRLVRDPSLADAVRRAVRVDAVTTSAAGTAAGWSVVPPGLPIGVAFAVSADDPTGPVELGAFAAPAGPAGVGRWPPEVSPGGARVRLTGDRVDVHFRPDPAAAVRTVDVGDVWDGTVDVPAVPVR